MKYEKRCGFGSFAPGKTPACVVLVPVVLCLVLLIPAPANAGTIIVPGDVVDAFMSEAPTDVDLPPLPADFFGPGSEPFEGAIGFPLEGYPYPDKFGPPTPFPPDQLKLDITWSDRHGNTVSADSQHRVSSNVKLIPPDPPYVFDTVVMRKDPAAFDLPGDSQTVDIEMTWLSLVSIDPMTITFNGGDSSKTYDVYVGLSATPQVAGRMAMSATTVGAGTVSGLLDLGSMGSTVDTWFEAGDFIAFDVLPDALGLPVFYQLRLENTANPTEYYVIDDHDGNVYGMKTTSVFHDQWENGPGGEFTYVPEPSALALLLCGLASLGAVSWRRRLRRR